MCMFLSCICFGEICVKPKAIEDACNICESYACYVRREVYVEGRICLFYNSVYELVQAQLRVRNNIQALTLN